MRILLDENLPQNLRLHLRPHDVFTTAFQGWTGWSNGQLLTAAEQEGFDVLITADQGLNYQQNLRGRKIALVVLSTNQRSLILANVQKILAALGLVMAGRAVFVDLRREGRVDH